MSYIIYRANAIAMQNASRTVNVVGWSGCKEHKNPLVRLIASRITVDFADEATDERVVEHVANFDACVEAGLIYQVARIYATNISDVFPLTNINTSDHTASWTENGQVELFKKADHAFMSSTSVGDIIFNEQTGERRMVASFGYIKL